MALMITDECINCDVCEPECPNDAITWGWKFMKLIPTSALNVWGITTPLNAVKCAQWIAFHLILLIPNHQIS